jgi:hypothetical protein
LSSKGRSSSKEGCILCPSISDDPTKLDSGSTGCGAFGDPFDNLLIMALKQREGMTQYLGW